MANAAGPKIIRDPSLILNLDSASTKSYPGTGTVWTDRTTNKNNGVFISGVAYSGGFGGGSIYFDGNQAAVAFVPNSGFIMGTNPFTMEVWCRMSSSIPSQWKVIGASGVNTNAATMRVEPTYLVLDQFNIVRNALSVSTFAANTWYHLVITRNSSNVAQGYINGTNVGSFGTISANFSSYSNCVGNNTTEAVGGSFYGLIPVVRMYNGLALNDSQVYNNYLADRGRFGY